MILQDDETDNLENSPKTKQCSICKEMLPANNLFFNTKSSTKSDLISCCKKCKAIKTAEYRKLNKEKCKKYNI